MDIFKDKYLDVETAQYIKDSAHFISEHGPDVVARAYIPVSDPSLPSSAPNPVKTVAEGFQSVPEKMVEHFLDASNK